MKKDSFVSICQKNDHLLYVVILYYFISRELALLTEILPFLSYISVTMLNAITSHKNYFRMTINDNIIESELVSL